MVLPHPCKIRGLRDSKVIAPKEREQLAQRLKGEAISWAIAFASVEEILQINILQASRLAMKRAVLALNPPPDFLLIDAVSIDLLIPHESILKGDALSCSIAAASILAKVERDRLLMNFDSKYPQYGLRRNKGYGTAEHLLALSMYGPTKQHRSNFAPVRAVIASQENSR